MHILVAKLGATGDVVRTTPLLRCWHAEQIDWLTSDKNSVLLQNLSENVHCFSWDKRELLRGCEYDLVVNLEDTQDVSAFLRTLKAKHRFGAYADSHGQLCYTDDARRWFDMSLVSRYGRSRANLLKLLNRRTYQELIFEGLGLEFCGQRYLLPEPAKTTLSGDVAVATESGTVWPMKKWAYYSQCKAALEERGLRVNILPTRSSLLQHLADVQNHRCLLSGDSLPMHFALATGTPCVALFTCTSPWEIYDYGLLYKVVSPALEEFFYQREHDERATTAITVDYVLATVLAKLECVPDAPLR